MRVLFSTSPLHGHILPLLPLARAFRGQGDSVAVLTGDSAAPVIRQEDVSLLSAGATVPELFAAVRRTTGIDLPADPLTVAAEAEFFAGARIDLGFEDALARAVSWKPDLIVSEMYDCVGPLVAAMLGVPAATVGIGPAVLEHKVAAYRERLLPRYAERGVELLPERWYLDTCPPSLQREEWERPAGLLGLRPEAHRPAGAPSSPTGAPAERARVLVTFGTLFSPEPAFLDPVVEELVARDVDVRITLGPGARASDFGTHGERVEFTTFTPLSQLLAGVDAVLTHGGSGTVLGTLAAGLPMVVVPLGADQPLQAEQVAKCGAGISFGLGSAPPRDVADAVRRVLAEPGYGAAARKAGAEIAVMPAPRRVAALLAEEIAAA